ncbi:DUF2046 domain-containing protein [Pyrobaculum aerophilum]|uniref:DUF2046 domain-containing protein n=1 Tax=Pyrobaculum aerophilum TaxID=13773 RepID=UPI0021625A38|nr:DUF2046 domain-containing protein [Pyrobaculum aerophilum]
MINIDIVFSSLVAQAPLVAVAVLILYYTLDKRIDKVKADLGGRIDKLENSVAGLSNRMERLENSVVALNNRVERLENSVVNLNNRVEKLEGLFAEMKSRFEELRSSVANLESRVEKLEGAVVEVRGRVEKLEGSVADLQRGVSDIKGRVERLEASVADVRGRVERLDGLFAELRNRVDLIGARLNAVRRDVRSLGRGFYTYQTALIDFLASKGVVNEPEAVLLKGSLKAVVPRAQSKYYTEEVRRRLIALLDKEIKDYTWDDVAELEKIAEAIYNEYIETGREDLLDYYPKLMTFIAIIRGLIRRREMERRQSGTVA